jgi:hypothetical protein
MVRIAGTQKVELGIAELILSDASFEFGTIASNETGGFVDNV